MFYGAPVTWTEQTGQYKNPDSRKRLQVTPRVGTPIDFVFVSGSPFKSIMSHAGSTFGECYLTLTWDETVCPHVSHDLQEALHPRVYLDVTGTAEYKRKTNAMAKILGIEVVNKIKR